MHISVAIVGFRNLSDIETCLAALARSTHADFDVVIWENGGKTAYETLVEALPAALPGGQPVRLFQSPANIGFPAGVNACIQAAPDADGWWVLNPDTQADPGALAALVARLRKGDVDAVGGVLAHPGGTIQAFGGHWSKLLARPRSIGYGRPLATRPDPDLIERTQNYILGASLLVSRTFRDVNGLMRGEYFLYCEETEWCLRAIGRGLRLGFAPDARVFHITGSTTGSGRHGGAPSRLAIFLLERNKMLLTRDLYPGVLPIAAVLTLPIIGWRYLRYGPGPLLQALDGWWQGLRDRRGPPPWISP